MLVELQLIQDNRGLKYVTETLVADDIYITVYVEQIPVALQHYMLCGWLEVRCSVFIASKAKL